MHYFKLIGDAESCKHLWQNKESLDKYLERLKELMIEDGYTCRNCLGNMDETAIKETQLCTKCYTSNA